MNIRNILGVFSRGDEPELASNESCAQYDVRSEAPPPEKTYVSADIEKNLSYIKKRFTYPLNNDVVIREIVMRESRRAFVIFIDGMVDTDNVDSNVIKPLLEIPYYAGGDIYRFENEISERFVSHSQAAPDADMDSVCEEINFGSCALFVDGFEKAFVFDVRQWGTRGIEKPQNEQSLYGPQEAFAEMLRNNTALIRKIIKTEKLIAEGVKIGTVSKTRGVLLYIRDIANDSLVAEVRRRINSIAMDYVISIEEVAMMLEEHSFILTPQIMSTERPDRAAKALCEGRAVLLLNGNPHALIFPSTAFEMFHAVSDDYMRLPFANASRIIRLIAMFISILLPGLYLAAVLFHHELIPTYLLYAISASRENVPFPGFIELLLMDISFEMIREAGIRMPGAIGSTLGIVGGLILGQAAVSAKIVSPLTIIVVAITGIGSFATADYSMSWTYRLLRLIFMCLGASLGFFGIAAGIFIYSMYLGTIRSFGVPFLSPEPDMGSDADANAVFVNPIWKRQKRPAFLFVKRRYSEAKISRNWKIKKRRK